MRPIDLDDVVPPPEPDATTRAVVHARSRALLRRRRAFRLTGSVSIVLVGVLVAGLVWSRSGSDRRVIVPATSPTTTVEARQAPRLGVVGRWRPLSIAGFGGVLVPKAILDFETAASFDASDGCNSLVGQYRLGPTGEFHVDPGTAVQTEIACVGYHGAADPVPVPNGTVVLATTRVAFAGADLVMLAADGHELARYAPAAGSQCVAEDKLARDAVPMPAPQTLKVPRVYVTDVHLDPPLPTLTPVVSPETIWRQSVMQVAAGSHYEIVLAMYSSRSPSSIGTSNGRGPNGPALAWVVVGQDVPLLSEGPGDLGKGTPQPLSCGTRLDIFDATTGHGIRDESFGTPTG